MLCSSFLLPRGFGPQLVSIGITNIIHGNCDRSLSIISQSAIIDFSLPCGRNSEFIICFSTNNDSWADPFEISGGYSCKADNLSVPGGGAHRLAIAIISGSFGQQVISVVFVSNGSSSGKAKWRSRFGVSQNIFGGGESRILIPAVHLIFKVGWCGGFWGQRVWISTKRTFLCFGFSVL